MQASTSKEDIFFLEARELFEEMVNWLSEDSVCGIEHGELENKLLDNGNERFLYCFTGKA